MKYIVLVLPICYLDISVTKEIITAEFNLEKLGIPASAHYFLDCCPWRKETMQLLMVSAKELGQLTGRLLTTESTQHDWLLFLCGLQL